MTTKLLLLATFVGAVLSAQNQPVLGEETVKVSDNVWAIDLTDILYQSDREYNSRA